MPSPYGGRERQIQIESTLRRFRPKALSAQDVENAITAQVQIIPAGTTKVDRFEYNVKLQQ